MNPYDPNAALQNWLAQTVNQLRQETDQKINRAAAGIRAMSDRKLDEANKQLETLGAIAQALQVDRTGTGIVRIEDLPGRRVPFDFLVDIPIGNNTTSIREASITISQEGPFVAVRRYATFQSAFEFQVNGQNGSAPRFSGRSFGRYRPIHSAWDLFDAQPGGAILTQALPLAAGAMHAFPDLPGSMSGFRTMEFDGRISVENAGSSYPRQNISVPSSLWTPQINAPLDLAALDFFERGEVITFRVQPNHVNNPPAGNVNGDCIFDIANAWPFLAGQYDQQEGICTPDPFIFNQDGSIQPITLDPIQRLPDGILTIGFQGYRIQQPVGPLG